MKNSIKVGLGLCVLGLVLVLGSVVSGAQINLEEFRKSIEPSATIVNEYEGINYLDIDLEMYSVEIKKSIDDKTHVTFNEYSENNKLISTLNVVQSGNTLSIREVNNKKYRFDFEIGILKKKNEVKRLIIEIPEEISGKFKVEMGEFIAENLELNNFDIESQMSKITLNKVTIKDSKLKAEMGSIDINDSIGENLEIETSMGSIEFNGKLYGKNEMETEMGSIDLKLKQKNEEIYLDTKTQLGSVEIKNGISVDESMKNNFEHYLKAKTSMGSIDIEFTK